MKKCLLFTVKPIHINPCHLSQGTDKAILSPGKEMVLQVFVSSLPCIKPGADYFTYLCRVPAIPTNSKLAVVSVDRHMDANAVDPSDGIEPE